jgi:hypothetical protein
MQSYTHAISTSYLVAVGLNPVAWSPKEHVRRDRDY